jgi:DeoR/GlpR family transcriptional regulator of sugar metabolism
MHYEKVSVKEAMSLFGVSEGTARRRIKLCRDALGMKRHQILTLDKLKEYYGIN